MGNALTTLQHFIYQKAPTLGIAQRDLYFRGEFNASFDLSRFSLFIRRGAWVSTSTFFNCFSLTKWLTWCKIGRLFVNLTGKGAVRVEIFLRECSGAERFLLSKEGKIDDGFQIEVPVNGYREGLIILGIWAMSHVELTGGAFLTDGQAVNSVRLGIVVTHYNQLSSVERLVREYKIARERFPANIELVVVDNSQNLPSSFLSEGVHILKNQNFGGSGGYARGKLYLERNGFTHGIYMDDDVDVDLENAYRVFQIFSYAIVPLAISGVILDKDTSTGVLQVGGRYKPGTCWHPVLPGLNMSNLGDLTILDRFRGRLEFGAFPFYAYSMASVRHYPFPFFVRGDDILFGLKDGASHKVAWPGVGISISSAEIGSRESPQSLYQDARALFVIELSTTRHCPFLNFVKTYARLVLLQLFSYKYASVESIFRALRDVFKGPEFFVANLDATSIRVANRDLCQLEKYEWCDYDIEVELPHKRHSRILQILTVNGLFLPCFLMKRNAALQRKSFRAVFSEIFCYRYVCYENAQGMRLMVKQEKLRILGQLFRLAFSCVWILPRFRRMQATYRLKSNEFSSADFWGRVYSQKEVRD